MTPHYDNGRQTRGKQEMQALAASAFNAVEMGELNDLFETLHARVFDRPPQELLDVELIDGVFEWRFKPMVELLLRHIADTAADRTQQLADRQNEIIRTVELLGF